MNKQIAIIGMACRFPGGVESPDDFWQLLRDERDAVTAIPPDRFGTAFYQHPSKREPGKSYTFAAGVVDDVAGFDAEFFGISPREAAQMDPQQRLLLELAWEAFEDAGVRPAAMRGRDCGVFVGVAGMDYGNRNMDDMNTIDPYSATGNTLSIASNRVSYLFDLRGPSMSVDTACSSSLVALHQAVRALQSGETAMALAGGVNLLLHPFGFVSFSKASMLSPRGRCRAFDATGDGYVRAEGGAFVLLKPLDQALADGDTIHAVIAGSGVNSDGHSHGGINVPAAATQADLLRTVYRRAGVDPRTLAYLEAHGTGTAVGDPIEARALIDAVSGGRPGSDPLLIGSVKTNIGHLETASGMAGLLKAVLCLKHRAVPRSLHFDTPNPGIDFEGGRLRVVDRFTPLERGDAPLTIGINSFGFGGTNAHVVITEAVAAAPAAQSAARIDAPLPPLVLTARSPAALEAVAARHLARLQSGADWTALAAAAARRRQWLEHRAVVAPADRAEGLAALTALAEPSEHGLPACAVQGLAVEGDAPVAFVYAGNGCQWAGMGKRLYAEDAVFRAALDEVDVLWRADGNASLIEVMCEGVDAAWLAATENAQPLLFAMQVGITRVLTARGIRFDAAVGHSVGEIAAAWASGALTLAEAVRVIRIRSGAQGLTRGAGRMAAAGIGEAVARDWIARLDLAAVIEIAGTNSPDAVTLAGSQVALEAIGTALTGAGHFYQMLDLDYAFHSSRMDAIEPVVRDGLADLAPRDTQTRFVSTVTGDTLPGTALDAGYWWRNIREPVRFGDAIARLSDDRVRMFVEIAPHSILRTYVKQTLASRNAPGVVVPTLKRQHDSAEMLAHAILSAVAQGARVDLDRLVPDAPHAALPTYPWQRERYWLVPSVEGYGLVNRRVDHPLLGYRLHEHAFAWENQLDPQRVPMLADHVVDGGVAFPGAGYVEMALAAARTFFGTSDVAIENVEIRMPVVFQPQHAKLFRFAIDVRTASFRIETRDRMSEGPWNLNVTGRLLESGNTLDADSTPDASIIAHLQSRPALSGDTLYAGTTAIGLSYGPAFRWVRSLCVSGDDALAELEVPSVLAGTRARSDYLLHPALMDSGFHPLFAVLGRAGAAPGDAHAAFVPVQIGRVDFLSGESVRRVLARIHRRSPHSVVASFEFIDAHGQIVARLSACRFRRVDLAGRRHGAPARFVYVLEARPLPAGYTAAALPQPGALVERANAHVAAREDLARRTQHLTELLPLLDVLAGLHALEALDALGAFAQPALPTDMHPQQIARLTEIVVEDGLARLEGDRLVRDAEACAAMPARDALWRDVLAASPAHVAELTLLAHAGAALPRVLRDAVPAGGLLSSTGRSLVEQFFDASPTWAHARALLAACVTQAVAMWPGTRRLRVLEIGTANGDVLQPLDVDVPAGRCEYVLAGTQQQLAGFDTEAHAQVQTLTFATDAPLFARCRDTTPFDVVIVNRMLGDHPDSLAALTAIAERLAPGGLVVIADARRSRFSDIVFGTAGGEGAAGAYGALAPAAIVSMCERAGLVDVVRDTEQGLDLEGVPTFVVARKPAAGAQTAVASRDDDRARRMAERDGARWLIVQDDDDAFGIAVAGELGRLGCRVESASVRDAAAWSARQPAGHPAHVVFVAPLASLDTADGAAVMRAQQGGALALASLVRDLDAAGATERGRLCIVTRGGAPFATGASLHPEHGTLWGLGRVIANEYPALPIRLVDVDQAVEQPALQLAMALVDDDGEEEVLLAPQGRYVPRMLPAAQAAQRDGTPSASDHPGARLAFDMPGSLRNLEWFAMPARALGAGEIEIEPMATGLNFRDVMYAMGLLSDEAVETGFAGATIGMEMSGRVARVGPDVDGFAPGDAVLGFAPASFAKRVVTRATAIARKPDAMSFEEAATVPTTFFTAYYALCELARLRRGERVLIHGGAGGVGIAAIQIARHLGAEVFATAGSDEKREFIRLLGVDRVFDSRSLAFADEILARTNGAGVDIVLNSLAGEAMVRSIDTLRPFGRFLELGKRDFYENSRIGLRPFRNNISYFGIDADQLMGVLPSLTTRLFEEVMGLFSDGVLHPLPYRAFPAARAEEAFRYMQQARQIGKVLVTYPSGTPVPARGVSLPTLRLDPHAAYLIVGGTGGLGFATARWMIERGARHLTLASRGGVLGAAMQAEADRWRDALGADVSVARCDVTDGRALDGLIGEIERRGMPLKGVLHSAMRIDDGLLRNVDDARFAAVLEPKVAGAWNLHRATQRCALDFFVMYSSATTCLGNPGQGAYVAANGFLEALVAHRRAAGQPAMFMAWGPIEDVGFLARNAGTREALQSRIGGASITSNEAMAALERALAQGGAGEAVVRLDWGAISRGMPAAHARRYAALQAGGALETSSEDRVLLEQLRALPPADAVALVETALRGQIARILHMSPERVDAGRSVLDLGMDSLMGMELGMAVEEAFGVKLSIMAIAEGATVHTLAERIVELLDTRNGDDPVTAADELAQALVARHALGDEARARLERGSN
ncbi:type I polyketide synthase [Burkholderia sp. Bp9142]|uniref:type I polyketide synthase n=1 Tax=Burkholderia sp. Bp9142 TaxID=2184573 RepID=UPI000F5B428B|nr:type I polyketide synthase [Burkholderia sp. Bp9142]RQR39208.1 SDR family NAD(P)-dependent oxidoreductase [Burkholderia sp. Bp9142]